MSARKYGWGYRGQQDVRILMTIYKRTKDPVWLKTAKTFARKLRRSA